MVYNAKEHKYRDDIKNTNMVLKSMENKREGKRPLVNMKGTSAIVSSVVGGCDLSVAYETLQKLVDEGSNFQMLIMTLGLALSYIFLSHALGVAIYKKAKRKIYILGALSIFLLGFMLGARFVAEANLIFSIYMVYYLS